MFEFLKRAKNAPPASAARDATAVEAQIGDMLSRPQGSGSTSYYPLSNPHLYDELFGPYREGFAAQHGLAHSAFYRCVFLIGGTIAMLDRISETQDADGEYQRERTSAQAGVLGLRPAPRYSGATFWRQIVSNMLMHGNGVAWIERDARTGDPVSLWPIPWGRVGVNFYKPTPASQSRLRYHLTLDDGTFVSVDQDDVLHVGGSPIWEIFRFMSPVEAYSKTTSIGLSADSYAKSYFDNGVSADLAISFPGTVDAKKAEEIGEYLERKLGRNNRFKRPIVMSGGADFKQLSITANDAALIAARRYQVIDIGRIFGVPPHLLNEFDKIQTLGKGLEELTQQFIDYTLGPHLSAIEDELNAKLYPAHGKRRARFDRDSFIRGDLKTRAEAMQILVGGAQGPGMFTVNDARGKLNMPRIKDPANDELLRWGATPGPEGAAAKGDPNAPKPPPPKKHGKGHGEHGGDSGDGDSAANPDTQTSEQTT